MRIPMCGAKRRAERSAATRRAALAIAALGLVVASSPGAARADVRVRFATDLGAFDAWLLEDEAPATVANFLDYVDDGDYAGSFFHRLLPGFVLQGGGYRVQSNVIGVVPADPPVANEFQRSNTRGTLAMAKAPGDPDSATSQFFVSLADNAAILDGQNGGFTAFGCVVDPTLGVPSQIEALPIVDLSGTLAAFDTLPVEQFDGSPVSIDDLVSFEVSRVAEAPLAPDCAVCETGLATKAKLVLKLKGSGKAKAKTALAFEFHGHHWRATDQKGRELRGTIEPADGAGLLWDLVPDACGATTLEALVAKLAKKASGRKLAISLTDAPPVFSLAVDETSGEVSIDARIGFDGSRKSKSWPGVYRLKASGPPAPLP